MGPVHGSVGIILRRIWIGSIDRAASSRFGCIAAIGHHFQRRPFGGREHHHLHDRFAVHALVPLVHLDGGLKLAGHIHELHRGAGVEPELIDNSDNSIHRERRFRFSQGGAGLQGAQRVAARLIGLIEQVGDFLTALSLPQEPA